MHNITNPFTIDFAVRSQIIQTLDLSELLFFFLRKNVVGMHVFDLSTLGAKPAFS